MWIFILCSFLSFVALIVVLVNTLLLTQMNGHGFLVRLAGIIHQISFLQTFSVSIVTAVVLYVFLRYKNRFSHVLIVPVTTGIIMGLGMMFYSVFITPFTLKNEARNFALEVESFVPANAVLYSANGWEPFYFYIHRNKRIFSQFNDVKEKPEYIILEEGLMGKLENWLSGLSLNKSTQQQLRYHKHNYFIIRLEEK